MKALGLVLVGFWYFIWHYLTVPVYNFSFFSFYFSLLVLISLTISFIFRKSDKIILSAGGFSIFVLAALFISTAPMFHAQSYYSLIGDVTKSDYSTALPPIDISQAPVVSEHMAYQVAQKKISDIPALGSLVNLGPMTKQSIKGKLYWVSFLEHSGFFQWFNSTTTPGYIKVSATNSDDVEFVQEVNGKPLALKYLESSYFGSNAYRKVYENYKTVGLTGFEPEIDDDGNPYIVVSVYENTVGVSGAKVNGVVLLNPQTGETQFYSLDTVPKWVDRVQPEGLIQTYVSDWGQYVHGFINPSDKDRLKPSSSVDLVYGSDGDCYFYIGITSKGKDNGIVGFMLVDSKTGKSNLYYLSGTNEAVASRSVVDVMREKGYHTTNPLPFSVNGVPTYVMALTDDNGIPRAYGMVNIQHYQVLAVSDSLKSTYQLYQNKLNSHGGVQIDENKTPVSKVRAEVLRISSEVRNGSTIYYLILKTSELKILSAIGDLSEQLSLTRPNDLVEVEYEPNNQKVLTMSKFENLTVGRK